MYLSSFLWIFLSSDLLCSNHHSRFHLHLFYFFCHMTSACCFSAPSFTSATFWKALSFSLHIYPPFSISRPFFSIICPSVPPLEKVTFAVKRSSPPLYHAVKKKMPWHYVPGGHSIDFCSHVSSLPLPLLLLWLPLSLWVCVSLPSHLTPLFLRGQGLYLTLCHLFPFMLPSG